MLLELKAPPKKLESRLINLVLPDFLVMFLLLAIAGNAAVVLSGIVRFPQVLLLVPAVAMLAAIISFARFFGFLSAVLRSMGAMSFIYDELGDGIVSVRAEFKPPLLLFGFLAAREFTPSGTQSLVCSMKADSSKYRSETTITADRGKYTLDLAVTDWRRQAHSRTARGSMPQLQTAAIQVINDIRTEVLEAKGVQVEQILSRPEAYRPSPAVVKTVAAPTAPAAKPAPAPSQPVAALPPVLEQKAVAAKTAEVRAELAKAPPADEKAALNDILFQLEEIDKIMKKK
jgi:hypothetical protein